MKRISCFILSSFSLIGGIEKFNKSLLKAVNYISKQEDWKFNCLSLCDSDPDKRYIDNDIFFGFKSNKLHFSVECVKSGVRSDMVIIGHINLAGLGLAIKLLSPKTHIILMTHGTEVWHGLSGIKRMFLKVIDKVVTVSNFTKEKLERVQHIHPTKITVIPCPLDPYFPVNKVKRYDRELLRHKNNHPILLTVCRLGNRDQYKGYDQVLQTIPSLIKQYPKLVYLLVGKTDTNEKQRINKLVRQYNITKHVILTGYVADDLLPSYYQISDVYIMPSVGEGFGIVYIESLASGTPVIAGNLDGSRDALLNGKLGTLVDPNNTNEIEKAIYKVVERQKRNNINEANKHFVLKYYNFDQFKNKYRKLLLNYEK